MRFDSTYSRETETEKAPGWSRRSNPQPARDEGGLKRDVVVEVELLLGERGQFEFLDDERDEFGLVLIPKCIGQFDEQIIHGHGGFRR